MPTPPSLVLFPRMDAVNRNSFAVLVTGLAAMSWACGGGDQGGAADADAPAPEAPAAETPDAETSSGGADLSGVELPAGVTAEMVAAGGDLWPTQICTTCHGPAAEGVTDLGPDLTDDVWLNSDGSYEAIVTTITNGVPQPKEFAAPMMPKGGMPSITEEQVRQLAAYIYALSNS